MQKSSFFAENEEKKGILGGYLFLVTQEMLCNQKRYCTGKPPIPQWTVVKTGSFATVHYCLLMYLYGYSKFKLVKGFQLYGNRFSDPYRSF